MKPRFFETQEEAAGYLGLAIATFNRLVKSGEIKGERVGTGEKRIHLLFSVDELDRYQMERMKKKLGEKFDKQFSDAQDIVAVFQGTNASRIIRAMLEGKEYEEALKDRIEPRNVSFENISTLLGNDEVFIKWAKHILNTYIGLHKDVKQWIDNQIIYHPISRSKAEEIYLQQKFKEYVLATQKNNTNENPPK